MDRTDLLVAGQAAALAGVLWPGRARWRPAPATRRLAWTLTLAGGALSLAGLAPHGRRITPRVRPPADAGLITTGVYAHTRNPIYAGLATASFGVALLRGRRGPLAAAALLTVVLATKARVEEDALHRHFGEPYRHYAARTPRLIPGRRPH
ncbi:methyltransferase family protein [Georgenia muralis]|uniref:Phospholipid methyltransferase n=1 Tax=Georgenia muralis TaxID=154117 RepID=A0A3N5A9R7_9MICO|nr:isoprenylcysteine carboxylmethyltransferase family protein [Georgenia muralis]RPF28381.1 phospholipid methyltransferase [Georgenia muralis]